MNHPEFHNIENSEFFYALNKRLLRFTHSFSLRSKIVRGIFLGASVFF
jgi:hypothetical protein